MNSRLGRNIAAVPERRKAASTRSGWRMLITLAHIPPPECPQRHQGTVAISAWPDFVANSSRARRKTRSEPCLGSNQSSAPPGVKSIASFRKSDLYASGSFRRRLVPKMSTVNGLAILTEPRSQRLEAAHLNQRNNRQQSEWDLVRNRAASQSSVQYMATLHCLQSLRLSYIKC